ncbi:hypothetical protein BGW38_010287, partial [Lunasporangiospora selenospora]
MPVVSEVVVNGGPGQSGPASSSGRTGSSGSHGHPKSIRSNDSSTANSYLQGGGTGFDRDLTVWFGTIKAPVTEFQSPETLIAQVPEEVSLGSSFYFTKDDDEDDNVEDDDDDDEGDGSTTASCSSS